MSEIILLNRNYIDDILYIQQVNFKDSEDYLISKEAFLEAILKKYIYGYLSKEKKLLAFIFMKKYDEKLRIYQIATIKTNQGIGGELMKFIINFGINNRYKIIFLEVHTYNIRAINFYFNNGFKIIEYIKNYYKNGNSAYQMKLEINR